MNTSLVTFDGYPRADIDVAQIRTTRARIVRLKNDYKALMAKVEVAIQEHFESSGDKSSAAAPAVQQAAEFSMPSSSSIEPPFAKVNAVMPGSPADSAGLKVGDKVTRFDDVDFTNHERLSRVAQAVQQNENVRIPTHVRRYVLINVFSGLFLLKYLESQLTARLRCHTRSDSRRGGTGAVGAFWAAICFLYNAISPLHYGRNQKVVGSKYANKTSISPSLLGIDSVGLWSGHSEVCKYVEVICQPRCAALVLR